MRAVVLVNKWCEFHKPETYGFVAVVGDEVSRVRFAVKQRIDDHGGHRTEVGDLARVVMSAPEHLYVVLLQQVQQCVGLLERHVRRMSLRAVALEQMRVGAHGYMAETLAVRPVERIGQPLGLLLTQEALAGVDEDIQVLLACRRANNSVVGRAFPPAGLLRPLVEVQIIIACHDEQRILLERIGGDRVAGTTHIVPVVLRIDQVAQMDSQRTVDIGMIVADELLPVRAAAVNVGVGADIYLVLLTRGIDNRITVGIVVSERLFGTLIDTGRCAADHTDDIEVPCVGIAGAEQRERQQI